MVVIRLLIAGKLLKIIRDFSSNIESAVEGRGTANGAIEMYELSGGARIGYIFNEIFGTYALMKTSSSLKSFQERVFVNSTRSMDSQTKTFAQQSLMPRVLVRHSSSPVSSRDHHSHSRVIDDM